MAFDMICEKDPGWQYLKLTRDQLMVEQSKPYDSKKNTWVCFIVNFMIISIFLQVPDKEEGFLASEIKSTKGDMVTVMTSKGSEMTVKKDLLQVSSEHSLNHIM